MKQVKWMTSFNSVYFFLLFLFFSGKTFLRHCFILNLWNLLPLKILCIYFFAKNCPLYSWQCSYISSSALMYMCLKEWWIQTKALMWNCNSGEPVGQSTHYPVWWCYLLTQGPFSSFQPAQNALILFKKRLEISWC